MPSDTVKHGPFRPPRARPVRMEYRPPGDKSIAHRGIFLASLSPGRSSLRGLPRSNDVMRTLGAVRALGVSARWSTDGLRIRSQPTGLLQEPRDVIHCGQSGTTMRLLAGLVAPSDFTTVLTGGLSLRSRPMDRIITPLRKMGARIEGRAGDRFAPLVIHGQKLIPLHYRLPVPSAQVKSALLLAALRGQVEIALTEEPRSRDHLEILIAEQGGAIQASGGTVTFRPGPRLSPLDLRLPGDPSSAAYFILLSILVPRSRIIVRDLLLNPTRTGFIDVLTRMGADLRIEERGRRAGEVVGEVVSASSELRATAIRREEIPSLIDEIPLLAMAAVRAEGEMDFPYASELRVKESDRISAIASNLRRIGVEVEERADGFTVRGTRGRLAGQVSAFGDHRIAMSFSVLGSSPGVDLVVDGAGCVVKSYSSFCDHLRAAAGGVRRVGP